MFLLQFISIIFAFGIVVFVHEFGHFIIGRFNKIGVTAFSIGFGPKLISFYDKHGTEWKLSLFPLGGYVKFEGDTDPTSTTSLTSSGPSSLLACSFGDASVISRVATVCAGPIANFLFSIFVFSLIIFFTGIASEEPVVGKINKFYQSKYDLQVGDRILKVGDAKVSNFGEIYQILSKDNYSSNTFVIERNKDIKKVILPHIFQPVVQGIEPLSAAAKANLKVGDVFLTVNGKKLSRFSELRNLVLNSEGEDLTVKIFREGKEYTQIITPSLTPFENKNGTFSERYRIGILGGAIFQGERKSPKVLGAVAMGAHATLNVFTGTLKGLRGIILGQVDPKHLSGPIGVAHAVSDSIKSGFLSFFTLIAIISTGIGIVNLLPVPILDGGHIILLIYEGIMKKKPTESFIRYAMTLGLILILCLLTFTTMNDLLRVLL